MKDQSPCSETTSRRDFVKIGAVGTTATLAVSATPALASTEDKIDVWVLHGTDNHKLIQKAMALIQENGGFGEKVKTVALKVNAAWARTPEEGANTHPDLVAGFLEGAKAAGVKKILMPEYTCNSAKITFKRSGIESVAKAHKCKMIDLQKNQKSFREVKIPKGRKLKVVEVASEFLDADAVVNMPVAKHHSGATVTMAMKNWMGAVKDRRVWHRTDLHQCIADFATVLKPTWTLVDATRCMMDSGPQGPAKVLKTPNLLIVSKDQVAADAYTSRLFHDSPYAIKYLKYAEEMGTGVVDPARMNIHQIEVG